MANVGSTRETLARGARIAGPRRVRATPPPLPPQASTQTVAPSAPPALPTVVAPRELPALDYEEPTLRRPSVSPTHAARLVEPRSHADLSRTTERIPRKARATDEPRSRSAKWFAVGLILGILGLTVARGDATLGVRAARLWGANTLRSLKKTTTPLPNATAEMAQASANVEPPPCSLTDDDCAILMAPFVQAEANMTAMKIEIPVIDVNALPKWKPPVVYVAPPALPAKGVDLAAPVAQPDEPAPAAPAAPTTLPPDDGKPKLAKRAPGPFDAPAPIDNGPVVASAPTP